MSAVKVSEQAIAHCNAHKMCKGCPFVGGTCSAPIAEHGSEKWNDWLSKMNRLIAELSDANGCQIGE